MVRGEVNDLVCLRAAAKAADGVIHATFNHDPARARQAAEQDRRAVEVLGAALAGSDRPLVVSSGTGLVRPRSGSPVSEGDPHLTSAEHPRAATEEAADALISRGGRVVVVRLAQVHDARRQGRISWHVDLARQQGQVAYVEAGNNRVAAVHVSDAVRLMRLALERGEAGERFHAVAEEGVKLRAIATAIGSALRLPVVSVAVDEAAAVFGWLAPLAAADMPATSIATRLRLDWEPTGPTLIDDLSKLKQNVAE